MKVLFVCSSNVCRSPYCEFVLRRLVASDPYLSGKIEVSSAALFNRSRKLFPKGRERLLREGFDEAELDAFKPCYKRDDEGRFAQADQIIGMSRMHRLMVPRRYRSKYVTISEAATGRYSPVPDPFLGTDKMYNATMDKLSDYVAAYFDRLKRLNLE